MLKIRAIWYPEKVCLMCTSDMYGAWQGVLVLLCLMIATTRAQELHVTRLLALLDVRRHLGFC